MFDLFWEGNGLTLSITVFKFSVDVFHFSKSNFPLDFLTKEMLGIPVKLLLCFNRPFVPIILSSHELSNLWGNKWIGS